jgi:LacI family transcriptional regulator
VGPVPEQRGALPTIKEIAKTAGVSYSTVSRALNNKKGVGPEMRERIARIAEEMGYFPHSSAKALVQNRIGVIGVVIPRTSEFAFQNPYYFNMLLGISSFARQHDYSLMLSINEQKSYASIYYRRLVDGIIVVGNRVDDHNALELGEKNIPAVVVPGFPDHAGREIASVNSENFKCVKRAVSYLISLGHTKIAFILGMLTSMYSIERLEAFKAAFSEAGLGYDPKYIVESDFSKTDGYRLMGELLDLPDPPSAVICINDSVTPGALHQIKSRGLKIPDEISVVAIGSSDILEMFEPPLTTIKTMVVQIGQTAARSLIQVIDTGRCTEKHIVIPSELIIRESTGPNRR